MDPVAAFRLQGKACERLGSPMYAQLLTRLTADIGARGPVMAVPREPEGGPAAFVDLVEDEPDDVREWLDRAPQTNEVGRATALYGGLLQLPGGLPVRLAEIGSSGGLNLRADRFAYLDDAGRRFGDPAAHVVLDAAWRGRSLTDVPVEVVERLGSDLHPVDPSTTGDAWCSP